MRVYFLSCVPAALKLNGMYLGTVDGFERHISLYTKDRIFAEFIPCENLLPVNFYLDEGFFKNPPSSVDLYFLGEDALIYIRAYPERDFKLNLICQTRFSGNLVSIFSQGGINLSIEGAEYNLTPLPQSFAKAHFEEKTLNNKKVLAVFGQGTLLIISERGKVIFLNAAESAEFGNYLSVTVAFETCTAAKAECIFSYDGESLTLISSRSFETKQPDEGTLHFAFFESVLTGGDPSVYLSDELKGRAGELKSFLGDFVRVSVPPEKFFTDHGNIAAAGLVYPKSSNLYEVKYFAVDLSDGKITNIYEVE